MEITPKDVRIFTILTVFFNIKNKRSSHCSPECRVPGNKVVRAPGDGHVGAIANAKYNCNASGFAGLYWLRYPVTSGGPCTSFSPL